MACTYPLQLIATRGKIAVRKETLADYRCACQTPALARRRTFFQETGALPKVLIPKQQPPPYPVVKRKRRA